VLSAVAWYSPDRRRLDRHGLAELLERGVAILDRHRAGDGQAMIAELGRGDPPRLRQRPGQLAPFLAGAPDVDRRRRGGDRRDQAGRLAIAATATAGGDGDDEHPGAGALHRP
jgi:hypothetical protein